MSFNPLISLARNAKRRRMEMQCEPQWVLELAAERDQLRAERDSHQRLCIAEMEKNAQLRAELEAIRGQEAEDSETVRRICDLFGIGSKARTQAVIMANVENTEKFARMLDAIEAEFFMVPGEIDPDYPDDEPYDCLVNRWACTPEQYVEQFRAALETIKPQQPDAVSVPSDTALRRAAKFLAGIDNGCNEVKTLRALVANAQGGEAVSVPRELLERIASEDGAGLDEGGYRDLLELRALLSTRQAEEGE